MELQESSQGRDAVYASPLGQRVDRWTPRAGHIAVTHSKVDVLPLAHQVAIVLLPLNA